MKSIKPGRGPSMMGAVGAAFAVVFGIIWTMAAASMGAPSLNFNSVLPLQTRE